MNEQDINSTLSEKEIFCFLSYCNKHRWAQWGNAPLGISGAATIGDTEKSTVMHWFQQRSGATAFQSCLQNKTTVAGNLQICWVLWEWRWSGAALSKVIRHHGDLHILTFHHPMLPCTPNVLPSALCRYWYHTKSSTGGRVRYSEAGNVWSELYLGSHNSAH